MDPAASRDQHNRIVSTGERPVMPDNAAEQPLSPKDERIVSATPSPDAANVGPSGDVQRLSGIPDPFAYFNILHTPTNPFPYEWDLTHPGYAQSIGSWDGYPRYASPEGLHVAPVVYNENPSLMFHPGFSFNPSPSIMLESQMFCPPQIPFSPSFFPHFDAPSAIPISPSETGGDGNPLHDPGSGYMVPFGPYGGGNLPGNQGNNSLASPGVYPQSMGILGPYEQNAAQIPLHGRGIASSSSFGGYPHMGFYQSPKFTVPCHGADDRVRLTLDRGRRRDRDQDSVSTTNDSHGNRGPRASKVKIKSSSELSASTGDSKYNSATAGPNPSLYNRADFVTDYKNAKFFIIKSFSEDNVHKSIKYNVWASTPHGNKKLDTAYHEAKKMEGDCPVFLFFSVNASGQFCGVSEMVGPVDFEKDATYWQQERWSGQFPVKWHIIKDVLNNRFCHILLQNNDNKPVTHSRDSQEVKLEQGNEMLKIFKEYEASTSILDDFGYYDEREKSAEERRKAAEEVSRRQREAGEVSIEQISEHVTQILTLADGNAKETNSSVRRGEETG